MLAVGALAALLTVWDYWLLALSSYEIGTPLVVMQAIALPALWLATFAWTRQNWLVAAIGLLGGLLGGWGYFYLPPLACVVLSVVAFRRRAAR